MIQQKLHDGLMPDVCGRVQGSPAFVIDRTDVGTQPHQQFHPVQIATLRDSLSVSWCANPAATIRGVVLSSAVPRVSAPWPSTSAIAPVSPTRPPNQHGLT